MGGFYPEIPLPGTFTCTACGEQRHAFGQEDGLCLKCRWTRRAEDRQAGGGVKPGFYIFAGNIFPF
jgi:hypothetical protein